MKTSSPVWPTPLHGSEARYNFTHETAVRPESDSEIANYARAKGLTIVSKDADFLALRFVLSGEQIRVVWVRLGNGSTQQVEAALRMRQAAIEGLADDPSQVIEIL